MNQVRFRLIAFFAFASLVWLQSVSGQMGYTADSLEWMVASSDVVLRGTIAAVEVEPLPAPKARYEVQTAGLTITLNVREHLKGTSPETVRFAVPGIGASRYEAWQKAETEILVFLLQNRNHTGENDSTGGLIEMRYRLAAREGIVFIRLGPPAGDEQRISLPPPPIFNMKLNILGEPQQILAATREAVLFDQAAERRPVEHRVALSRWIMEWSGRSGDANVLSVPVDARLELMAREMIESSAQILATRGDGPAKRKLQQQTEEYYRKQLAEAAHDEQRQRIIAERDRLNGKDDQLRLSGIHALRHFKSDRNIELLKGLLNDPASWMEQEEGGLERRKTFFIRRAVYETLRAWNIDVEKPILQDPPATEPVPAH